MKFGVGVCVCVSVCYAHNIIGNRIRCVRGRCAAPHNVHTHTPGSFTHARTRIIFLDLYSSSPAVAEGGREWTGGRLGGGFGPFYVLFAQVLFVHLHT